MTTHRYAIAALLIATSAVAQASLPLTAAPRFDGKAAVMVMPSVTKLPTLAGPVPIPYPSSTEPVRTTPVPLQQPAPARPLQLLPMPVRTPTP